MKVLHLSTSDIKGGAARGAYFLHRHLRAEGIASRMLVGRRYSEDPDVRQLNGHAAPLTERIRGKLDVLPLRPYDKTDDSFWTLAWQPRHIAHAISKHAPDIVHIHWTGGGYLPVSALRQIDRPIVWTMRDMWPFTGGCHYTANCARYQEGCGFCPQLRSRRARDPSRVTIERKRRAWGQADLCLVPISRWLADRARESCLFANAPIDVIPNGIDTTRFRPYDKAAVRRRFGMHPSTRIIMFVALNALSDQRKGLTPLLEALRRCDSARESDPPELLIVGNTPAESMPAVPIPTRFFGTVDDDERLAQLYAAADLVAAPSLQEAFGKVHVEAMACGTPVLAFNDGGPSEIVRHRETGYLAEAFEPEDLARGVDWCLETPNRTDALGDAARARAEAHYDTGVIARRYIEHYHSVLRTAA